MTYGYRTRRGEQAPNAVLGPAAREYIREQRAKGVTYVRIAQELGVSEPTVRRYDHGETYCEDDA